MTEFLLAFFLVALSHLVQGNVGLDLSDEGFLWNGVLRTVRGEVPTRDFHAYEPGRYYWCAAWTNIFGRGILGLRLSVAAFQFVGLWLGLLALQRVVDTIWVLAFVGIYLLWWMQPRHKYFDPAICLISIFVGVSLIETPELSMFFAAGVWVGISYFFGVDHGVYNSVSFFLLASIIWFQLEPASLWILYGFFLCGVIVGQTPIIAMLLFVPSMFKEVYARKILPIVKRGGKSKLFIPIPWPWLVIRRGQEFKRQLPRFLLGSHFLLLPIFYTVSGILLLATSVSEWPLLAASVFTGIPYLNHAFSRADLPHLCSAIQPFLVGVLAIIFSIHKDAELISVAFLVILTVIAYLTVRNFIPLYCKLKEKPYWTKYSLNGELLWLPKALAGQLTAIQRFVETNLAREDTIFIAPYEPALYPVLNRRSVMYSDFLLVPSDETQQRAIIGNLEDHSVNWILIDDRAIDGLDSRRFSKTHPIVWDYISANFGIVEFPGLGPSRRFYTREA